MEKWATPVRRKKKKQQRCEKRRPISLFDLQNVKNTIPGTPVNGIAEKDEHAEKHCAKDNNVADEQVDLGKDAYFVCLSVMPDDPRGLSLQMARDTYIGRNSINGYIPDPYNTLRYGQLGCGGFIVFGNSCCDVLSAGGKEAKIPQLRIADKKTTAYTRAEPPELAFKHVEHLVKGFLVYGEHPVACPGETVEIRAHESKPDLNGKQGTVMEVLPPVRTNPQSTHSNKTSNTVESTPPKPKTTASSGTPASTVETCCSTPPSLSPTSRSTSTSSEEKNVTVTSSSRASNRYRVCRAHLVVPPVSLLVLLYGCIAIACYIDSLTLVRTDSSMMLM